MYKKFFSILLLFGCFSLTIGINASAATLNETFTSLIQKNKFPLKDQAFCFQDPSGTTYSHNNQMRIIPASVSKLYTFDFAFARLGKDFRYTTDLILNDSTLYINGGGDPHFVIENLESILEKIATEQRVTISRIVVGPRFYFNWKDAPSSVKSALQTTLKKNPHVSRSLLVTTSTKKYTGTGTTYQFSSAPLSVLMKQINDYSTNISADILFKEAGGSSGFLDYMKETYNVDSTVVSMGTGSGLKNNYTTCDLTLRVIKHLQQQLAREDMKITDVMSVPKRDPGVLNKRLLGLMDTDNIVAKSGTINYHQSLAGVINTQNGPSYFAIFIKFPKLSQTQQSKDMIDSFVQTTAQQYIALPFSYTVKDDVFGFTRLLRLN